MTELDDGTMLCRIPHPASRALSLIDGGWLLGVLVVLVVVAVAHLRLGPSSSATTSTTERALPSSDCQDRCASRPTTMTRLPSVSDSAAWTAWSRQTTTAQNASPAKVPAQGWATISRTITAYSPRPSTVTQ
jgi:hypothetical protein